MKKIVAFMLVMGMATLAQAAVISIVTAGLGSDGHAGTSTDPLIPSETIELVIVLNHNPYPGSPSYDGYWTNAFGLDVHVSGPGTLGIKQVFNKAAGKDINDITLAVGLSPIPGDLSTVTVEDNKIDLIGGFSLDGVRTPPGGPSLGLVFGLLLHCDGIGNVTIDLTLADPDSQYAPYATIGGAAYGGTSKLVEGDLGDLVIHQIPEPMTLGLLALGGLGLLRRRRA